jgi:hypothetical protein
MWSACAIVKPAADPTGINELRTATVHPVGDPEGGPCNGNRTNMESVIDL